MLLISRRLGIPFFALFLFFALALNAHASDVTPPALANIRPYPGTSTTALFWTTDEAASSRVFYGLTSGYGSSTGLLDTAPRMPIHTVLLSGLNPCTTYHYQVFSDDADGNSSTSTDATFTTFGCAQPAGESYYDWSVREGSGSSFWFDVDISSNGERVLAAPGSVGYLKQSADNGASWSNLSDVGLGIYFTTAMSADGRYILTGSLGGNIRTSSDFGSTWESRTGPGTGSWYGSAISDDGMHMVIADVVGYVYISHDYGVTWTQLTGLGIGNWNNLNVSSDSEVIALSQFYGGIRVSRDGGDTWQLGGGLPTAAWAGADVSDDGNFIVALSPGGYIWTSYDAGVTWSEQRGSGVRDWYDVAIVPETNRVIAVDRSGYVYVSEDAGVTWAADPDLGGGSWLAVSVSDDGRRVALASPAAPIYTGFDSDVSSPLISSVRSTVSSSTATVTWITNEHASSQVYFGLTNSYGSTTTLMNTSTRVLRHSVEVTGLASCTEYHYAVRSEDSYLNVSQSDDRTFTTTGCPARSSSSSGGSRRSSSSGTQPSVPSSIRDLVLANRDLFLRAQALGVVLPSFILDFLNSNQAAHTDLSRDLEEGMTGSDVLWLQQYLVSAKTGAAADALRLNGLTQYFGPLTKAALKEWQQAQGIYPVSGYFGPKSRAVIQAL